MDPILNPIILYTGLALGAVGVAIAMPRKGVNPQVIGAMVAGIAIGAIVLSLAIVGLRTDGATANLFFYIFAAIGLGAALRVVTHQRPVYAALYFILTIISSAGLFLLLAAEFMTFAIVIIYAGAILITYLFVIMLATQAPTEEAVEAISEYDAQSREPILSTIVGFALLAALIGMMGVGVRELPPPTGPGPEEALKRLPGRVQTFLEGLGIAQDVYPAAYMAPALPMRSLSAEERAARTAEMQSWLASHSGYTIAPAADGSIGRITLTLRDPEHFQARIDAAQSGESSADVRPLSQKALSLLAFRQVARVGDVSTVVMNLPPDVAPENLETVGLALVGEHPLSLELAGVILLLAMIGAVVLSRKQTEVEEERKAEQAHRLRLGAEGGAA